MASAAKKTRVVLRTAADALQHNLNQQYLLQKGFQRQLALLKRDEDELRKTIERVAPITVGDLPVSVLAQIFVTGDSHGMHDDLLRRLATRARVCRQWYSVAKTFVAYGLGLTHVPGQRARVLQDIAHQLDKQFGKYARRSSPGGMVSRAIDRVPVQQYLPFDRIGDAGMAVLVAALHEIPCILYTALQLESNDLTDAGMKVLAPALRQLQWGSGVSTLHSFTAPAPTSAPAGLLHLCVRGNYLHDDGLATLASALPPTLESLDVYGCGFSTDGLIALVDLLPRSLRELDCGGSKAESRAFVALANTLPVLPAIESLFLWKSANLGLEGATALAMTVPQCALLRLLKLDGCFADLGIEANRQAVNLLQALGGELEVVFENTPWRWWHHFVPKVEAWVHLDDWLIEAAGVLGWDERTWGHHTDLTQKPFAELTKEQQEAADVLGFDASWWDEPDAFQSP